MGCTASSKSTKKNPQPHTPSNPNNQPILSSDNLISLKFSPLETQYQILKSLSSGAFGRVQLAKHKTTGLHRAVKTVKVSDDLQKQSITHQVQLMKQLKHPNIVRVFQYYEDSQNIHIILQYCQGGDLLQRVTKKQVFSQKEAAWYIKAAASGISYLHRNKIIHRDLKPANLLLLDNNQNSKLKIADFNGAIRINPNKKTNTFGTLHYMAPEVFLRQGNQKVDVWSLGVILYMILCGRHPFDGNTQKRLIESITNQQPNFQGRQWSSVSDQVKSLLYKMLTKDQNLRPCMQEIQHSEWIRLNCQQSYPQRPISIKSLSRLQKFNQKDQFVRATLSYIAQQFSSYEEIKSLQTLFEFLDKDSDGKLTAQELANGFNRFGIRISGKPERMLNKLDGDRNGFIDYKEFLTACIDWQESLSREKLMAAFKAYDINQDGYISLDELRNVFGRQSEKNLYLKEVIQKYDHDDDELLDFEEFSRLMKEILQ